MVSCSALLSVRAQPWARRPRLRASAHASDGQGGGSLLEPGLRKGGARREAFCHHEHNMNIDDDNNNIYIYI